MTVNFFRRLYLYTLSSHYGRKRFEGFLQRMAWAQYNHYPSGRIIDGVAVSGEWVTLNDRTAWEHPAIQSYWKHDMRHDWRANLVGGGSMDLGRHNRSDALLALVSANPRATVIHVDDLMHFIFYKTSEVK